MTAVAKWLLVVLVSSTTTYSVQPPADGSNNQNGGNQGTQTAPSGQTSQRSTPQGRGGVTNPSNGASGRQLGALDVDRGTIPELFSRDRSQNGQVRQTAQPNLERQAQGRQNRGGQNNDSPNPREFIQNALRFDANSDQQLAANELANLFHMLATAQRQLQHGDQRKPNQRRRNDGTVSQRPLTTQTAQTTTVTSQSNPLSTQANTAFIQRQSVRQSLLLFLQLALQFDLNGDGLLNQRELLALANALINSDMSLLNAATQRNNSGINGSATRQSTITRTQTTTVPQRNAGVQNRPRGNQNRNGSDGRDVNRYRSRDAAGNADRPGNRPNAAGGRPNAGQQGNVGRGQQSGNGQTNRQSQRTAVGN